MNYTLNKTSYTCSETICKWYCLLQLILMNGPIATNCCHCAMLYSSHAHLPFEYKSLRLPLALGGMSFVIKQYLRCKATIVGSLAIEPNIVYIIYIYTYKFSYQYETGNHLFFLNRGGQKNRGPGGQQKKGGPFLLNKRQVASWPLPSLWLPAVWPPPLQVLLFEGDISTAGLAEKMTRFWPTKIGI